MWQLKWDVNESFLSSGEWDHVQFASPMSSEIDKGFLRLSPPLADVYPTILENKNNLEEGLFMKNYEEIKSILCN